MRLGQRETQKEKGWREIKEHCKKERRAKDSADSNKKTKQNQSGV